MKTYLVKKSDTLHNLSGNWDSPLWEDVPFIRIDNYLGNPSNHRPETLVKALHNNTAVHVLFKVTDRYVRAVRTRFQSDVWNDSCVEWFAQPLQNKGYINFEINAGGTMHASYVEDPAKNGGVLKKSTPLSPAAGAMVEIFHSLPSVVEPEISGPIEWHVEIKVPVVVFEMFTGPIGVLSGQAWRANFNKCADGCSHPAWATWNPVSELNFHRPWEFGEIGFE